MRARGLAVVLAAALILVGPATGRIAHYGGTITIGTSASASALDPTVVSGAESTGFRRILPAFCLPLYSYASNHGTLELDPILAAAPPAISTD
jgi:hypothetical protein